MSEVVIKSLVLLGAGALLCSASSFAQGHDSKKMIETEQSCSEATSGTITGNSSLMEGHEVDSDALKDEIISEQLTRNIHFYGSDSQHEVSGAFAVVIGLGGVGSHAASMLLRSGISKLLLVDFDQVALLAACVRRGLKVLSDTDVGGRADPTRIRIADLKESVTFRLKRVHNIESGVPVVFSLGKRNVKLLPFKGVNGVEENPAKYNQVDLGEVMYVVKELWKGRSARKWDQAKPASVSDLILQSFKEDDEHESRTTEEIRMNEPDLFARVTSTLKRAEQDFIL